MDFKTLQNLFRQPIIPTVSVDGVSVKVDDTEIGVVYFDEKGSWFDLCLDDSDKVYKQFKLDRMMNRYPNDPIEGIVLSHLIRFLCV